MEGLVNLNSGVKITKEDQVFVAARAGFLSPHFYGLPIYMVDPDLMDRVYPPRRRRFLNPRCVEEILREFDRRMEEEESETHPFDEDLWERLERCRDTASVGYFVAMGVYLPSVSEETREVVKEATGKTIDYGRAIFVCPERVEEEVQKAQEHVPLLAKKWGFRFLLAQLVLHELAHAYMDGGRAQNAAWERLIEESLANAFAYQSLVPAMGDTEKATIEYIISKQPLEYRGWRYFIADEGRSRPGDLEVMGMAWRKGITPFQETTLSAPRLFHGGFWWAGWIPFHIRERLAMELWDTLPHPWDEIIREWLLRGELPTHFARRFGIPIHEAPKFWPTLSLAILRALV